MSLSELADEIVEISTRGRATPVLVTRPNLTLRPQFFFELAKAAYQTARQPMRIDWFWPVSGYAGLIRYPLNRWSVARQNRAFSRLAGGGLSIASVQLTASIARPGQSRDVMVVGFSGSEHALPSWTVPIRIG